MTAEPFVYALDDRPPLWRGLVYGLQWALLMFPSVTILASRLRGFPRTAAIMLGMLTGSLGFWAWGRVDLAPVGAAAWISLPDTLWAGMPQLSPSGVLSCLLAYVAVTVNAVGSIHGTAAVVGPEGVGARTDRGLAVTGVAGIAAAPPRFFTSLPAVLGTIVGNGLVLGILLVLLLEHVLLKASGTTQGVD